MSDFPLHSQGRGSQEPKHHAIRTLSSLLQQLVPPHNRVPLPRVNTPGNKYDSDVHLQQGSKNTTEYSWISRGGGVGGDWTPLHFCVAQNPSMDLDLVLVSQVRVTEWILATRIGRFYEVGICGATQSSPDPI